MARDDLAGARIDHLALVVGRLELIELRLLLLQLGPQPLNLIGLATCLRLQERLGLRHSLQLVLELLLLGLRRFRRLFGGLQLCELVVCLQPRRRGVLGLLDGSGRFGLRSSQT